jgi:hypothetical protein
MSELLYMSGEPYLDDRGDIAYSVDTFKSITIEEAQSRCVLGGDVYFRHHSMPDEPVPVLNEWFNWDGLDAHTATYYIKIS